MQGRLVRSWLGGFLPTFTVGREYAAIAFVSKKEEDTHQLMIMHFNDKDSSDSDDFYDHDDSYEEDSIRVLMWQRVVDVAEALDMSTHHILAACFDSSENACLFGQHLEKKTFWIAVWSRAGGEPVVSSLSIPSLGHDITSVKCSIAVHDHCSWAVVINNNLFLSPACSIKFRVPASSWSEYPSYHAVAFSGDGQLFVACSISAFDSRQVILDKDGVLVHEYDGKPISLLSVSEDGSMFSCVDEGGVVHSKDSVFIPFGPFGVEVDSMTSISCTNTKGVFIYEHGVGVHKFI